MLIYLKDYIEEVLEESLRRNEQGNHYSRELLKEAINAQISNELRYNIIQGKTFTKEYGLSSEYVDKNDLPTYESLSEAAIWEFTGYVRNSASRKQRGYSLI